MTKKELKELYYLNREIEEIINKLNNLESSSYINGSKVTGLPCGTDINDSVGDLAADIADIKQLLELRKKESIIKYNKILRYIDSIDDARLRLIFTYRYINGLSWQQVAVSIGNNTADSVRVSHDNFFRKK